MKNIILFLLLGVASLSLKAQNLTMAQLLQIKNMKLAEAEEYLTARGWEFHDAKEDSISRIIIFVYNSPDSKKLRDEMILKKDEYYLKYGMELVDRVIGEFTAESNLYYLTMKNRLIITISTSDKSKYGEYMAAIKGYGCTLLDSKAKDGTLTKVYRGATTTFLIKSSTEKDVFGQERPNWSFVFSSNDD